MPAPTRARPFSPGSTPREAATPPVAIWGTKQAVNYARDHSVEDRLRQMGWLQGAIWSNQHVRESVSALQHQRAGSFAPLSPQQRFSDLGCAPARAAPA